MPERFARIYTFLKKVSVLIKKKNQVNTVVNTQQI